MSDSHFVSSPASAIGVWQPFCQPWLRRALKCALPLVLIASLGALFWFSLHLAGIRIYQVDECMEVYVARLLAQRQDVASGGHITLFQILLSLVVGGTGRSIDFLVSARCIMLEVFWLNILLIAVATGEKLFSTRGLWALVGAATLAPLWDYGFEIRHDNLLLTGILATWLVLRARPDRITAYCFAGAMATLLEFTAFKAFVYTIAIFLFALAFAPSLQGNRRWKLAIAWVIGALSTLSVVYLILNLVGLWQFYVDGCAFLSATSAGGRRFGPGFALGRLLTQTPLLLALICAGLLSTGAELLRRKKATAIWEGQLPEVGLFLISLLVLLANPAPFPYNLVLLVPFGFLAAFRYGSALLNNSPARVPLPALLAVVVFAHLVPFTLATRRHLDWTGFRQDHLMGLAEDLTDPKQDPVYDAIGMVSTRPIVSPKAFLHSFNIQNFVAGSGPRLRDLLAANPPAVFIPSYRTDWLPAQDHDFIRSNYVSLADDFWVLGKQLPTGGGEFDVIHAGRYRIAALQASDLAGTYPQGLQGMVTPEDSTHLPGILDGKPLPDHPVELSVGRHRIECPRDCQPTVVWVGPNVERVHRLAPGDHDLLFVNWY